MKRQTRQKTSNRYIRDEHDKTTSHMLLGGYENPGGKVIGKTILARYTTLNHASKWGESSHISCKHYEVKLSMICIGHTRLTHWHLMSKNNQQPTCRNQRITIKKLPKRMPSMGQQIEIKYLG